MIDIWKRRCSAYLPIILWMVFIFILSSQPTLPGFELDTADFIFKKSAHMFVFAILYWLVYRGLVMDRGHYAHRWWQSLLVCLAYAIFDEIHQSFTPHRSPSIRDVGFDILGSSSMLLWLHGYL